MANTLGIIVKNGNYEIELQVQDEKTKEYLDWSLFDFVAVAVHTKDSRDALIKWTNKSPTPTGWKAASIDGTDSRLLDMFIDDDDLDAARETEAQLDIMTYKADANFEGGYAKGVVVSNEPISIEIESNSLTSEDLI